MRLEGRRISNQAVRLSGSVQDTSSEAELSIYRIFLRRRLTEQLQIFYQLQKKMIEPESAESLQERLSQFMRPNVARVLWNDRLRTGFPMAFQEHVDQQLSHQD